MNYTCPICSENNHCEIEDQTKDCWCTMYTFTNKMYEMLSSLPTRCICISCAEKQGAIKKELSTKNDNYSQTVE